VTWCFHNGFQQLETSSYIIGRMCGKSVDESDFQWQALAGLQLHAHASKQALMNMAMNFCVT
jgi:hypothetical protein